MAITNRDDRLSSSRSPSRRQTPGVPVLLATGYTNLPPGSQFPMIGKPFSEGDSARILLRAPLDQPEVLVAGGGSPLAPRGGLCDQCGSNAKCCNARGPEQARHYTRDCVIVIELHDFPLWVPAVRQDAPTDISRQGRHARQACGNIVVLVMRKWKRTNSGARPLPQDRESPTETCVGRLPFSDIRFEPGVLRVHRGKTAASRGSHSIGCCEIAFHRARGLHGARIALGLRHGRADSSSSARGSFSRMIDPSSMAAPTLCVFSTSAGSRGSRDVDGRESHGGPVRAFRAQAGFRAAAEHGRVVVHEGALHEMKIT